MIRVLIADDHPLVREGLRTLLKKDPAITVVGESSSISETREAVAKTDPQVLLLDISFPTGSGIDLARELSAQKPKAPHILFISMHGEHEFVLQAFKTGASGYLLKSAGAEEIQLAIHEVAAGRPYISPRLSLNLLEDRIGIARTVNSPDLNQTHEVSDREKEVIRCIAAGMSAKEIGEKLGISHRTVETHRSNAMRKVGAKNTAELIRMAAASGILEN